MGFVNRNLLDDNLLIDEGEEEKKELNQKTDSDYTYMYGEPKEPI